MKWIFTQQFFLMVFGVVFMGFGAYWSVVTLACGQWLFGACFMLMAVLAMAMALAGYEELKEARAGEYLRIEDLGREADGSPMERARTGRL